MTGTTLGTANLAFNENDGEASVEVTKTFPEVRGMECFCVVQFADARDHPELGVAFQDSEHAPVRSGAPTRHWFGTPA